MSTEGLKGQGLAPAFSQRRSHSEIFYVAPDGYPCYRFVRNGVWESDTVSFRAAGRSVGSISTVYSPERHSSELYFIGENDTLNTYQLDGSGWKHRQILSGEHVNGIWAVYSPRRGDTEFFYTRGEPGVRFFYRKDGEWIPDFSSNDLDFRTICPRGPISALYSPKTGHSEAYYYCYANGNMQRLYKDATNAWKTQVVLALRSMGNALSAVYVPVRNQCELFYVTEIHDLAWSYPDGSRWRHEILEHGVAKDKLSAVYSPLRQQPEVFFCAADGFLNFCYRTSDGWAIDSTSFREAGPVAGSLSAVYSPLRNHSEVYFCGLDGNIHFYYVKDGAWVHDQVLQGFASQSVSYSVASGETMSGIAARFGLSLQELLLANRQVTNPDLIYANQALQIPGARTYTIKSGDTLGAIATAFCVSVFQIVSANPQIADPDRIYAGQQITVPPAP